jgi:SNF2 family DNA or RNA helicase
MLQHRSIAYEEKECLDVPKFTSILEEVSFPEEAAAYYQRAIKTIIESKGNARAVSNIFLRMRQLSSGFMGFMDDDTGEKAQVEFEENPKLDRLLELLEELPVDRKAVVFYDFTWSGRLIAARAKEMGLNPIWVWAGTKDYRTDIHNFETKPQCRLAVVQNKVGAYSLDELKVANYCFFYESPVSVIDREQAEKRLRRQGQTRRVFQFDLVVRGSMDARILYYHQEGEDMMKALLRDPQSVLKGM